MGRGGNGERYVQESIVYQFQSIEILQSPPIDIDIAVDVAEAAASVPVAGMDIAVEVPMSMFMFV